jgi:hypothetical protein
MVRFGSLFELANVAATSQWYEDCRQLPFVAVFPKGFRQFCASTIGVFKEPALQVLRGAEIVLGVVSFLREM